jgi:hypothetical protein
MTDSIKVHRPRPCHFGRALAPQSADAADPFGRGGANLLGDTMTSVKLTSWNSSCKPAAALGSRNMANQIRIALLILFTGLGGLSGACAHQVYFPNSTIPKTEENGKIIETVEQYRRKLLEHSVEGLLLLASDRYFEDSGTPRSDDDYGYEGLKTMLGKRLARVNSMRYDIEYRSIKRNGNRAEVEVFLDGSFELAAKSGDRYRRVNDFHRFVLERQGPEKWQFLSGM